MAEYNWWDDRTIEENDDMICPIISGPCLGEECDKCEELKNFLDIIT